MTASRRILGLLAGICLGAFGFTGAQAGSIQTPIMFSGGGNQIVCIASNASTQSVTVTVLIIGFFGNSAQTCTLTPADRNGCQAFRDDAGRCRITVAGLTNAQVRERVRGVLFGRTTAPPFTTFWSVQAQ
jgi:hypothetical protein